MSLWLDGIPDRFMTPIGAAALGLFIAGAFIVVQQVRAGVRYYATEPTRAPLCYKAHNGKHVAGTKPIPRRGERSPARASVDDPPASYKPHEVVFAQTICTVDACSRAAWETYRSEISRYVSARTRHITRLDRMFGDAGLQRAHNIYATAENNSIERHLSDLYVAGVFRINDFRDRRDAITLLIFKSGAALRPCRTTDTRQETGALPRFYTQDLRAGLS